MSKELKNRIFIIYVRMYVMWDGHLSVVEYEKLVGRQRESYTNITHKIFAIGKHVLNPNFTLSKKIFNVIKHNFIF